MANNPTKIKSKLIRLARNGLFQIATTSGLQRFALLSIALCLTAMQPAKSLDIDSWKRSRTSQVSLEYSNYAPNFSLSSDDGSKKVSYSSFKGKLPVVLIFGSYSDPTLREKSKEIESLYKKYKSHAQFLFVYIREAHPSDGFQVDKNRTDGIDIKDPQSISERSKLAHTACKKLGLTMPCLVDDMEDSTNKAYGAWPLRFLIIDKNGHISVISKAEEEDFALALKEAQRYLSCVEFKGKLLTARQKAKKQLQKLHHHKKDNAQSSDTNQNH